MGILDAPPLPAAIKTSFATSFANNGMVVIGDSITAADVDTANNIHGNGWASYMAIASNGRLRLMRNAGVGGETSTSIAARFTTDVLAHSPGYVGIMAGTNDTNWTTQTLANVEAMIRAARNAGVRVFLLTQPPAGKATQPVPGTITTTASTASGTLPAATYDYVITAIMSAGTGARSTLQSATATETLADAGNIQLDWPYYANAAQWNVFRRISGVGTYDFVSGFGAGFARTDTYPTFTDDGSYTVNAAVHPAAGDASGTGNWSGTAMTAVVGTKLMSIRQVVSLLGAKYGIPVVDAYDVMVDKTTGLFKNYYTSDGTHPTPYAQRLMGDRAWTDLADMFPPTTAPQLAVDPDNFDTLLASRTGPGSIQKNAALLPSPTTGSGVVPNGWSNFGDAGGTPSLDSGSGDGIPGNVLSITNTGYAGRYSDIQATTGFSVGDRIRCAFKMKCTGLDANGGTAGYKLQWLDAGLAGTGNLFVLAPKSDVTAWKTVVFEGTIPASTVRLKFELSCAGRDVTVYVAQVTIENLTTRGLGTSARSF
jgi:lysophospholipase L1-like esterase